MSEIMMAGPMVRRLLDGTKTQTRRVGPRWTKVKPGDVLHVREAFAPPCEQVGRERTIYAADWGNNPPNPRWTPAVHMPMHLCRMRLLVKRVWQERADGISEADAIAEGMEGVTIEDFVEMGGSRHKIRNKLPALGWTAVAQFCAAYGWRHMSPAKRFQLVVGVLGAKPDEMVTAIEFEVIHDNR